MHERLLADPPARVADVACGEGHSSLAIARGYPKVRVDGIDMDAASIEAARRHLAGSGLDDRVAFHLRDAADEELAGRYDLVYIHEALHDMSYLVRVLSACRSLLADGGVVIVGDERVPDEFDPPGEEIGTGTVMRAGTVRRYARRGSAASRCCRSKTTSIASTGSFPSDGSARRANPVQRSCPLPGSPICAEAPAACQPLRPGLREHARRLTVTSGD